MQTIMIHGTPALGVRLSQWQAGGDALHHVGSYFVGKHPVTLGKAREALAAMKLNQKIQTVRVREFTKFAKQGVAGAKKTLAEHRKALAHAITTTRQLDALIARAPRRAKANPNAARRGSAMRTFSYTYDGKTRRGRYDLSQDRAACQGGTFQSICTPYEKHSGRRYGYSHGGEEYRALMDALYAREGEEAILRARRKLYGTD